MSLCGDKVEHSRLEWPLKVQDQSSLMELVIHPCMLLLHSLHDHALLVRLSARHLTNIKGLS